MLGQALQVRRLDEHHQPLGVEPVGDALAGAHQPLGLRVRAHGHQQPLARGPGATHGFFLAVVAHRQVDAVGGLAQCQFAQRNQIALAEEVLQRPLGLLRDVHPAFAHALQQVIRRYVDQLDFVGLVEHAIR